MMKNRVWSRLSMIVILMVILFFSLKGEKVAREEGAGWDGVLYREMAMTFTDSIGEKPYNTYQMQRVMPFAIVNIAYTVLGIAKDNETLMTGMCILNLLAVCLSLFYFYKISDYLKFSIATEVMGFSMLFFNYHTLQLMGYYPFFTDEIALMLSILIFYYFIVHKNVPVLIFGILGSFTWPTLLLVSLLLIFLPRNEFKITADNSKNGLSWNMLNLLKFIMVIAIPISFLLLYILYVSVKGHESIKELYWCTNYINIYVLFLSLLAVMYFAYRMFKPICFQWKDLGRYIKDYVKWSNIIYAILIYIGMHILLTFLSNEERGWGSIDMIVQTIVRTTTAPFMFLEAHFAYFGILCLLVIFWWRKLLDAWGKYGLGYLFLIGMFIVLAFNSESRYMIFLLPFVAFPVLAILNRLLLKNWVPWAFVVLSLILSLFWLKINVEGIEEAFMRNDYNEFPAQRYFITQGPWQSHEMYLVYALTAISIGILIYIGYRKGWYTEKND